jgi:HK97 family phage prohead protease
MTMNAPREVRNLVLPVSIRAEGEGQAAGTQLVGYAAKFNDEATISDPWWGDTFSEVIKPGAFARTLRENQDIRALYNHDTNVVLGRTKSGTLKLTEDATGLHFVVDLADTTAARDIKTMIARGDIDGCSFGFMVMEDEVLKRADGTILRTLIDLELIEISPAVAFPAYASTEVAVRSQGAPRPEMRDRIKPAGPCPRLLHSIRALALAD